MRNVAHVVDDETLASIWDSVRYRFSDRVWNQCWNGVWDDTLFVVKSRVHHELRKELK